MTLEELTHKNLIIPEEEHITEEAAKGRTTKKIPIWVGWPVPYHTGRLKQENHCEYQANLRYAARSRFCLKRTNRGNSQGRVQQICRSQPDSKRVGTGWYSEGMVVQSSQHVGQWKEDGEVRLA